MPNIFRRSHQPSYKIYELIYTPPKLNNIFDEYTNNCEKVYCGMTKSSLKTRLIQHQCRARNPAFRHIKLYNQMFQDGPENYRIELVQSFVYDHRDQQIQYIVAQEFEEQIINSYYRMTQEDEEENFILLNSRKIKFMP